MKKELKEKLKNAGWVCIKCGLKYGRRRTLVSTFHLGKCDICGEEKSITEIRDYNYLHK